MTRMLTIFTREMTMMAEKEENVVDHVLGREIEIVELKRQDETEAEVEIEREGGRGLETEKDKIGVIDCQKAVKKTEDLIPKGKTETGNLVLEEVVTKMNFQSKKQINYELLSV